jgi:hypothetical protein
MSINYDIDVDNEIVKILQSNGYDVDGSYIHSYSTDESNVYVLSDGYYAKYYSADETHPYSWNEMKELFFTLSKFKLTPTFKEFIDIDNKSGLIINDDFGVPYSEFQNNSEIEELVITAVNSLHNYGYIHGDIHMDNILVNEKTKEVRFIDLDN